MPLESDNVFSTNKDGSRNTDYCIYCYQNGEFTQDVTMTEMMEISLTHMKKLFGDTPGFDETEAIKNMQSFFPGLKRWA